MLSGDVAAVADVPGHKLYADTVRQALDGFAGMMGDTEVGSTILDLEIPFFEEAAGTVGIHRVMQDYQIGHTET